MATYLELEQLINNTDFQKRILYALKQKGFQLIVSGSQERELINSLYTGQLNWPIVQYTSYAVSHPLVMATGAAITDANLQIASDAVFSYLTGI